jgi:septation ring formation regulator EzrA
MERLRSRLRGLEKEVDNKDQIKDSELDRMERNFQKLQMQVEEKFEELEERVNASETVQRQSELPMPVEETVEDEKKETVEKDRISEIEEKIDNLAEHVLTNQEKLHELESKVRADELESAGSSSKDITIVS